MADGKTDHKVLVKFEADTKKLREAMGQVTGDSKKFQSQNKKFQQEDFKNTKKINDLNTKQTRQERKDAPLRLKHAKELTKLLTQQTNQVKQQTTFYGRLKTSVRAMYTEQQRRASSAGVNAFHSGLFGSGLFRPAGQGGSQRGGGSRAGTGGSSFLRAAAGSAGLGLVGLGLSAGAGLLSMPFGAIGQQYDTARAYRMQLSALAGYAGGGATKANVDAFRTGSAQNLGYTAQELIGTTRATARATGSFEGTGSAMALGRLLGEDPTAIAGMFGTLRQAGTKGFTEKGAGFKALTQAIAAGMTTGLEKARMPEFLEGVMSLTQRAASREGGDVSSAPFARLLATLGRSGASGLQGARGAQVASALEEGFTSPGAGEEGMAIALSAMGFGRGGPGGNKSYYQARKGVQMGTSGDPNFIKNMIERVNAVYGGGEEANLAIEQMLGGRLSLSQIEEVQKAMAEGGSPTEIAKTIKAATESERDILQDIRNLLSGGNNELLAATRESLAIENENIDRGTELTEALEDIHKIFRDFIGDMLPAVKTVLEELKDFLTEMKPVLGAVALAVKDLVDWLTHQDDQALESHRRTSQQARIAAAPIIAGGAANMTPEQEQVALAQAASLFESAQASRQVLASEGFVGQSTRWWEEHDPLGTARMEDLFFQGLDRVLPDQYVVGTYRPRTSTNEEVRRRSQEDISNAYALYDTIARAKGFRAADGATDTPAEIRAMLTFLVNNNVTLPESVRAVITNTGGSQ